MKRMVIALAFALAAGSAARAQQPAYTRDVPARLVTRAQVKESAAEKKAAMQKKSGG